ncbi:MAG: HD domain-containing phosphohydrolase [Bacilli bacterium]
MKKRKLTLTARFIIIVSITLVLATALIIGFISILSILNEISSGLIVDQAEALNSVYSTAIVMIFVTASLVAFIIKSIYDMHSISKEEHIAVEIAKMTSNIDQQTTIDKLDFWNDRFVKLLTNYTSSGLSLKLLYTGIFQVYMMKSMKTEKDFDKIKKYTSILVKAYAESYNLTKVYNDKRIAKIADASVLYDMGKLGTPGYILYKEDNLSSEQMEMAKRHAQVGLQMAKAFSTDNRESSFEAYLKDIAGYHHERYDGTGYPEGIKGEEIPFISRIIAVVTTYDTVTRDRPYRRAMSHDEAVLLINNEKGRYFDPKIVKIFNGIEKQFKKINDFE